MILKILKMTCLGTALMAGGQVDMAWSMTADFSKKKCSSSCIDIQTNYISAVKEFITEAISMYNDPLLAQEVVLRNQIAVATVPICGGQNDYSSNTLKPYFDNIINTLKTLIKNSKGAENTDLTNFYNRLIAQGTAMEKRIEEWKVSKGAKKPCKDKNSCGDCDLGLPGTACANTVPICSTPLPLIPLPLIKQ